MALNRGDWMTIRARALDPLTGRPLDPMPEKGEVAIWAPGKRYETDLPDFGPYEMQRNADVARFTHVQDTTSFAVGRHVYRITFHIGSTRSIEYGAFLLEA